MTTPAWIQPIFRWLLGRHPKTARHVVLVLATTQMYAVNLGILWHSVHFGFLDRGVAWGMTLASLATIGVNYALVRSGWSQRFADPVLSMPHALASIALCFVAYISIGPHRANVMILVAEAIVMAMFRLRPHQMLLLGLYAVAGLLVSVLFLVCGPSHKLAPSVGLMHFVIGGSTLLTLSMVAKWVTDIRVRIGAQAKELSRAVHTLQHMATQDTLTGLLNRRVMTDLAESEMKLALRHGTSLTVAIVDLDHFKQINDRFGHAAGDAVLRGFAGHALAELRRVDKIARWGGEEFLILLPQVSDLEAVSAIERLRQATQRLRYAGFPAVRATFSAGVAQLRPGETMAHWLERADHALYRAKASGRNRTDRAPLAPTAVGASAGGQPNGSNASPNPPPGDASATASAEVTQS